jgi:hypothetical protein
MYAGQGLAHTFVFEFFKYCNLKKGCNVPVGLLSHERWEFVTEGILR